MRTKIQSHVACPPLLRAEQLRPFLTPECARQLGARSYELVAVVEHRGRSIDAGHYVAHCRSPVDPAVFLEFDDSAVKVETEGEVLAKQAYLVFYQLS